MKIGLVADIHANLEALVACLAHGERHGVDQWSFLGDLVGYGADPEAVLDVVALHASRGAIVVRGNHDEAVLHDGREAMNKLAERAVQWTRERLGPGGEAFLRGLPLVVREGDVLHVHASAAAPSQWIYVDDTLRAAHALAASDATYTVCGHVHDACLYYQGLDRRPQAFNPTPALPIPVPRHRRWLAVAGACGQPRDGNPAAAYAILDTARHTLTFHRVAYDHHRAARKIATRGLPTKLAERVVHGM